MYGYYPKISNNPAMKLHPVFARSHQTNTGCFWQILRGWKRIKVTIFNFYYIALIIIRVRI